MNRKLKALGLALFATMALGAFSAQGAMGETFNSEVEETHLTGIQEHDPEVANRFILDDGNDSSFECTDGFTEGIVAASAVAEVTVTPTIEECGTPDPSSANIVVDHTSCNYILSAETEEATPEESHAPVSIECDEGDQIEITISGVCSIGIGEQDTTHGAVYTNEGSGTSRDITVDATVHGIDWEVTSGEFLCTLGGLGAEAGSDATYLSKSIVQGFADAAHTEQVGIWYE